MPFFTKHAKLHDVAGIQNVHGFTGLFSCVASAIIVASVNGTLLFILY